MLTLREKVMEMSTEEHLGNQELIEVHIYYIRPFTYIFKSQK